MEIKKLAEDLFFPNGFSKKKRKGSQIILLKLNRLRYMSTVGALWITCMKKAK